MESLEYCDRSWLTVGPSTARWVGLGSVALRFTFALLWMIGLFGLSGYRLDCIRVRLDWIGLEFDCNGLG